MLPQENAPHDDDDAGSIPNPKEVRATLLTLSRTVSTDAEVIRLARCVSAASAIEPHTFSTEGVCSAMVLLWPHSRSVESVRWLCGAICNIAFRHEVGRAALGTAAMRDALALGLATASSSDEVRLICSAVSSLTTGEYVQNQQLYGTGQFLEALCTASLVVNNSETVHWWCATVCNIVAKMPTNERLFGTSIDCMRALFRLVPFTRGSPLAAQWWCTAVANLCRSENDCREAFATACEGEIGAAIVAVAHACCPAPAAVRAAGSALSNLALCETARATLALSSVRDAWTDLAIAGRVSPDAVLVLCCALCNLTSGGAHRKHLYGAAPAVRDALVGMAPAVTTVAATQYFAAALCNIATTPQCRALLHTVAVRDALVDMAHGAASWASGNVVLWWTTAVCRVAGEADNARGDGGELQVAGDEVVWDDEVAMFGGPDVANALVSLAKPDALASPQIAASWSKCLHCLGCQRGGAASLAANDGLRDAVARVSAASTSPDAVTWIAKALCAIVVRPDIANIFADNTTRTAFLTMGRFAHTPEAVCALCSAVSTIVTADAAFQEFWGSEEARDCLVLLADVASKSQDAIAAWTQLLCNATAGNRMTTSTMVQGDMTDDVDRRLMRDALALLGVRATSPTAIVWVCSAICNLTASRTPDNQLWVGGGDGVVCSALVHMARLAAASSDKDAMVWVCRAMINCTVHPTNQQAYCREDVRDALAAVGAALTCDAAAEAYCCAVCNIAGRFLGNQDMLASHSPMRDGLLHALSAVERVPTALWWVHAATLLASRPCARKWLTSSVAIERLGHLARHLVQSEEAVTHFCGLLVLVFRGGAGAGVGAPPLSAEALSAYDAMLRRVGRRIAADPRAMEYHERALAVLQKLAASMQPTFLPLDTESILSLPPPTTTIAAPQRTTFSETVNKYTSFRRLSSR